MVSRKELTALRNAVISNNEDDLLRLTKEALEEDTDPNVITAEISDAMRFVGDSFESGELFLPELILAGDAAMKAMALVNDEISKRGLKQWKPGKVLMGTVKGDLHNIGKDTVAALLMAAGFEVHDIGVNVAASRFFSEAESLEPDIIGLSALMTTTIRGQQEIIELFQEKGNRKKYKILVGGGAVTPEWAQEIGADGYGADAAEAVKIALEVLKINR